MIFGDFYEVSLVQNPNSVQIRQKYQTLYINARGIPRCAQCFLSSGPNVNISEFTLNAAIAQLISHAAYSNSPPDILYLLHFPSLCLVSKSSLPEQRQLPETVRAAQRSVSL
jgi:hypothetical protein